MKKVVISCGPIPARLDSVKFITNKFKGGLAFKTASKLLEEKMDLTIVKWSNTDLPDNLKMTKVININDVFEYYEWFKNNAKNYDAFIMAAAVANLTPSNPYEGKFPSHNYSVGEKFNIEFEIAPRAIDIVKKENPRCCLIGYKLFDAKSDEELIDIAKHTLKDSKANIIFANTPKDAKNKKIALFQDDTNLTINFDEHVDLIIRAINQEYFKTNIVEIPKEKENENKIKLAFKIVEKFEETITGYGTIGIKISDKGDFVTTSRGHRKGAVYIQSIDVKNKIVYASDKATLNAPIIHAYLQKYDYFIHRHEKNKDDMMKIQNYLFPGTVEEYNEILKLLKNGINCIYEKGHGYLKGYNYKKLDWNNYYNLFPNNYFSIPDEIKSFINNIDSEDYLDVGCNLNTKAKYYIDPFVTIDGKHKLNYSDLDKFKFKLITLNNSINYLNKQEIQLLINCLDKDGILIANSFLNTPEFRLKQKEAVYKEKEILNHYLIKDEENVYYHNFNVTNLDFFIELGFNVLHYGTNSIILKYKNEKKNEK